MRVENLNTITGQEVFWGLFDSKLDAVGAVFQALGWFHTRHWARGEDAIGDTIIGLCENGLKNLREGKEATIGTGGLEISLLFDEDEKELTGSLMVEL